MRKALIIGILIGAGLSLVLQNADVVPWEQPIIVAIQLHLCLTGIFLGWLVATLIDIFQSNQLWASQRFRVIGVAAVGAMLGLFILSWIAVLCPSGLEELRNSRVESLLFGGGSDTVRKLWPTAELLAAGKTMIDEGGQFASCFAAALMIVVFLYDRVKPTWKPASFFGGMLLPMPVYLCVLIEKCAVSDAIPHTTNLVDVSWNTLFVSVLCGAACMLLTWAMRGPRATASVQ